MNRITQAVRAFRREVTNGDDDPAFWGILLMSVALCAHHLSWGLPNGNFSWGNDAIGPLSVLAVGKRSLASFNSGWFWYKYPFGYPLLLLIVYAPFLGWLFLSGRWSHPSTTYPYGFEDPEGTLYRLAMMGRVVSVVAVVGMVALTYGIAHRLAGRTAARLSAWFLATSYVFIYYAHTTNQDAVYAFWLTLSLWSAMVCAEGTERRWPFVVLGVAAAMAMATKEQGFSLLLTLPPLLAASLFWKMPAGDPWATRAWMAMWNRGTRTALLTSILTALVGFNVLFNPQGFVNRLLDLTGHPIPGLSSRLTPLKFSLFKGWEKEWWYLGEAADGLLATFGPSLALLALAGLLYLLWKRPRLAWFVVVPTLAYYFVSLRIHNLICLRYMLPIFPPLAVCAGFVCASGWGRFGRIGRVVVALLCLASLARAVEVNLLFRFDPRYDAEAWMAANVPAGSSVEYYQKEVYMPRFPGFAAKRIPLEERSLAGIAARQPRYIVTSDVSRRSITHLWNPDWTKGGLLLEQAPAREFLDALKKGELPYREVAHFVRKPTLLRMRLNGLRPSIHIYERTEPVA